MNRWVFSSLAALALASCSAPTPPHASLCDLPRNLAGWNGTDVRWSGIVVGSFEHGFGLVATDCQHRGITLDWDDARSWEVLDKTLRRRWREPGVVRADVSGKIARRGLLVTDVHRVALVPMSYEAEAKYMRSLGF